MDFAFEFCLGEGRGVVDGLIIADRSFKVIPHIVTFYSHTARTVEFTFDDIRLFFMSNALDAWSADFDPHVSMGNWRVRQVCLKAPDRAGSAR